MDSEAGDEESGQKGQADGTVGIESCLVRRGVKGSRVKSKDWKLQKSRRLRGMADEMNKGRENE